jgi:hypothetical protein
MLSIVLMASCSSTKSLKKSDFIGDLSEMEYLEKVVSNTADWNALTAKMTVDLNLNGKSTGKVGGTLRIKRGEVIQISLAPFFGIEVGRAEISPNGMLVIDRVNKRYVQVSFDELKKLTNVNLDFHVLEALFLNEMFLPGKPYLTSRDKSLFDWDIEQAGVILSAKKSKMFSYRFFTDAPEGRLMQSRIALTGSAYALNWNYDKFEPLKQSAFPTYMHVSFEGAKKPSDVTFQLSRLTLQANWEAHTDVSKKYQKVELDELIKILVK